MNNLNIDSLKGIDFVGMGMNVLAAFAILIIGFFIAGRVNKFVFNRVMKSPRPDEMLAGFFGSMAKYLVIAITVIAVLTKFGVNVASLVAILGAAGLAIGLALQGTLSHVAAGVMLIFFRPFKIGDYVETAGVAGTVKSVTLFTTELVTPDNVQIIVPNGTVWGAEVRNFSFHDLRRVDITVGIGYGDDIEAAKAIMVDTALAHAATLNDPAIFVAVANLGESSVDLVLRVWAKNADYWTVKFDLTQDIKQAFDANNISIPFPQRDVHQVN